MGDTNTTPTPETPDNPASTPETPQGNNGGTEATFTQSEVNKIAAQRAKEAQERERKKVLEELEAGDFESAKALLADAKKRKESELSEAQKLQTQLDAANKKAQEAEQRAKDTESKYLAEQRRSAFESAVTTNGGNNAKRVYALLQLDKPNDFLAVFGEDATPDEAKMKALIKQVQADYPEYFGSAGAGSPSAAGGIAPTSLQRATEDAKKEIDKKFGKL